MDLLVRLLEELTAKRDAGAGRPPETTTADRPPLAPAQGSTPPVPAAELARDPGAEVSGRALGAEDAARGTTQATAEPAAPAVDPLDAEIDAAFAEGRVTSGTMFQFSDKFGPLSGSGPKQGTGDIWFHDNVKIPGAGPNHSAIQLRTHAANPNAPPGSYSAEHYTTQVSTNDGKYRLPDGTWKTIAAMTPEERAAAHYPAGG